MILDEKELRIGNLVLDSTKNTTLVETLIPEHNRVRYGIPLTKSWLLKLGADSFGDQLTIKLGHRFFVYYDTVGFGVFTENTDTDEDSSVIHEHIKCVHQLQNLYYALAGKELTIT